MIKLMGVTKIYRYENIRTYALQKIDLEIKAGEFLMIMGPSGSGKSTLLNVLGLIDKFDEGEYFLNNQPLSRKNMSDYSKIRNQNIGMIFQGFNLISDLDVYTNVELPLIYRNESKKIRKEKVNSILQKVNIEHRKKHYPHLLSGGEKQRVAIARALIIEPLLLLADEPTGNLDSEMSTEIMNILFGLNKEGKTIIMVTHNKELTGYASRVIQIKDGKVFSGDSG